jgi:hypothetical protein
MDASGNNTSLPYTIPQLDTSKMDKTVKDTLTEIGKNIISPSFINNMDDNNKTAAHIMNTKGIDAAVEHMFKHPNTGKPMSYSEMRSFYG